MDLGGAPVSGSSNLEIFGVPIPGCFQPKQEWAGAPDRAAISIKFKGVQAVREIKLSTESVGFRFALPLNNMPCNQVAQEYEFQEAFFGWGKQGFASATSLLIN